MNTKIYIYIKYSVQIFGSKLRIFSNRFEVMMEKGKIPLHPRRVVKYYQFR